MRKSHSAGEIVRLNGAAFRLNPEVVHAGALDALVEEALSRVLGGVVAQDLSCVQYNCNLYAPKS
ncbi:MAG TPA: hypothetical protein VKM72_05730 [Thermoanaerobaculia bacterium]|nr:hypothetical protein [Thermoanaerobaculia bacterium]